MRYKITLRLGAKTFVEYVEADSLNDVLNFYRAVSRAKVSKVELVVYEDNSEPPPDSISDRWNLVKVIARRNGYSRQYIFHAVKRNLGLRELSEAMRRYLRVHNGRIEGVLTVLWK